jgi:hypothetical protein
MIISVPYTSYGDLLITIMANESCGKWYKGYKHQIKDCYPEKPSITKLDVVERVIMSNPKKPKITNLIA